MVAELLKLSDGIHTRIKSESVREGSNKRQRFSSEIVQNKLLEEGLLRLNVNLGFKEWDQL
jgi:hypothetical protein